MPHGVVSAALRYMAMQGYIFIALDAEYFFTKFFKKLFEHAFECQDDDFSQN